MMKKRGQQSVRNIIVFFIIIVVIMGVMLTLSLFGAVLKETSDAVIPGLTNTIDNVEPGAGNKGLSIWNTAMSGLSWALGGIYFISLIGILGLAYAYRVSGEKFLMILFFTLTVLVILASIFVSNTYEDLSSGQGEIAQELRGFELLTFLMIYSPIIITLICLIGGAIMFSGFEESVI